MALTLERLDHVVINCRDAEVTASWYQRVLGMSREVLGPDQRTRRRAFSTMRIGAGSCPSSGL